MYEETISRIPRSLEDVPDKTLKVIKNLDTASEKNLFTDSFQTMTTGKG